MFSKRELKLIGTTLILAWSPLLIIGAGLPGEWFYWDDPNGAPYKTSMRLDGANSALASGTWDLSSVTIICKEITSTTATTTIQQFPSTSDSLQQKQQDYAENMSPSDTVRLYNGQVNNSLSYTSPKTGLQESWRKTYFQNLASTDRELQITTPGGPWAVVATGNE